SEGGQQMWRQERSLALGEVQVLVSQSPHLSEHVADPEKRFEVGFGVGDHGYSCLYAQLQMLLWYFVSIGIILSVKLCGDAFVRSSHVHINSIFQSPLARKEPANHPIRLELRAARHLRQVSRTTKALCPAPAKGAALR